ncbi:hypothetical protein JCGZ_13643 [Jatropha curcas]|uniref:Uncharacterized protein n=1 Tax=Jatropha curcas TaxID=180498 RepID=A0A067KA94_JATCU|nr:hypothetical protein JCGZ_13643 [Jatropha curcas]
MADGKVNEIGFSPAQLRGISDIIAAAFAQERAQNQVPPSSSNQSSSPLVVEREAPEPTSGNQASAGNVAPGESNLIKQLAELKDKVEKMSVLKEKVPVTNFHVAEYVLKPTSSTSSKTFKHTLFEGDNDPRSHLSEFIRVAQMNRLADQADQWYYSSDDDVNEVGVQSLTRSGRVYNHDNNSLVRGKGIVIDGTEKKVSEKGEE